MFKKQKNKIHFVSTVQGLESIKECLPKPAKYFIPKWFKDIPTFTDKGATVKNCPSFPDYFSLGYIIPMWCDVKLQAADGDKWQWETPINLMSWDVHSNNQFLDYKKANFNGLDAQFVFKPKCPWRIITPPGWSVLQLPLFYHFNQEWSVMPGVIDTDIHHEINQQVLYHGNGKEITIKCGDPFVLYVPFKRSDKLKHEIEFMSEQHEKKFRKDSLNIKKSFSPNGIYRKMQRERDKGV